MLLLRGALAHLNITDLVDLINLAYKVNRWIGLVRKLLNLLIVVHSYHHVLPILSLVDYLSLLLILLDVGGVLKKVVELRLQRHVLNFVIVSVLSQLLDLLNVLLHLFPHGFVLVLQRIPLELVVLRLVNDLLLIEHFLLQLGNLGLVVLCFQLFFYLGL